MNSEQVQLFKLQLLDQQQALLDDKHSGEDAAAIVKLDQTSVGRLSRMDALQGQAMSQEMERRREIELQKINAALRRIESGDYGVCIQCEEDIAIKRLQFDPSALLCIQCANESEK